MRIIAGIARGRQVNSPRGSVTRPTSDRVREALFSSMESRAGTWAGSRVLDVFAGSGAMGLEALSRGAASAVFVESDKSVVRTLRENVERVGLQGAQVVALDAWRFAAGEPRSAELPEQSHPFDRVVCDPPYSIPASRIAVLILDLVGQGWIEGGCDIVVERPARDLESPWPDTGTVSVQDADRRTYGDTALWYGHLVEREP